MLSRNVVFQNHRCQVITWENINSDHEVEIVQIFLGILVLPVCGFYGLYKIKVFNTSIRAIVSHHFLVSEAQSNNHYFLSFLMIFIVGWSVEMST